MGVKVYNYTRNAVHGSIPGTRVSYFIPVNGFYEFEDVYNYEDTDEYDKEDHPVKIKTTIAFTAKDLADSVIRDYNEGIPKLSLEGLPETFDFLAAPNKRVPSGKQMKDFITEGTES